MTILHARHKGKELLHNSLGKAGISTPQLDADCLLAHVLCTERSDLFSHANDNLSQADEKQFFQNIEKRLQGLPVAYITHKKEFFGYDFFVTEDVLIPKPDTELLTEHAIKELQNRFLRDSHNKPIYFADVCTGSGCIAISVLKSLAENPAFMQEFPDFICDMTDISQKALHVAKHNAEKLLPKHIAKHVNFFQGDLLQPFDKNSKYDIIVSNPPYVPASVVDELLLDGRNEPRLALDGDVGSDTTHDGLAIIRRLLPQVWDFLAIDGVFLLETGEYNAFEAKTLLTKTGFDDTMIFNDLTGQPRLVYGKKI
ncbi:MAG: peptide chain release factor N(5)-glutamine methyltransferase [Spirochaetales bacterium]